MVDSLISMINYASESDGATGCPTGKWFGLWNGFRKTFVVNSGQFNSVPKIK